MTFTTFDKPLGFSLSAASAFYAQFIPGAGMASGSSERSTPDALTLGFRLDGSFEAVAARLEESGSKLRVAYAGTRDEQTIRAQLARMLGLEGDASAWRALGEENRIVGDLQRAFPGFFTAAKSSPYDAATWAVLAPRMQMRAAAALKIAMTRAHGDVVMLGAQAVEIFPAPARLVEIEAFEGVPKEKMLRLRGVARAALEGRLEARRLRAMRELDALTELQELRGVGPWAASHIYYRGAAPIDALPTVEPRVLHGLAELLGEPALTVEAFERIAETFKPFRMWVSVLLSRHLARAGGWRSSKLAPERAAQGRQLARRTRGSTEREHGIRALAVD